MAPVRCSSCPRSVSVVGGLGYGAVAASITVDSPTRQGRPARRPAEGRRAGPTKGWWVGLEKRKKRRGALASAKLKRRQIPL